MHGIGSAATAQTRRTLTLKNGKTLELGKLTYQDFACIREEAAAQYKRSLIQTYTKNMDLVPAELRATVVQQAFEKAEKITPDELPLKTAWLPREDAAGRPILNTDQRFYHDEAGQWIEIGEPLLNRQNIEYSGWWMAFTNVGRLYTAWLSARHCQGQESLTLDELAERVLSTPESLKEAADVVGDLSQQRLGNAEAPLAVAGAA